MLITEQCSALIHCMFFHLVVVFEHEGNVELQVVLDIQHACI